MNAGDQPPIDKSIWGPGPWQTEPDRWEDRHAGRAVLAVRSESSGVWCGYVGVPPGHPWHGKGYDDVGADAHGGLTYSGACQGRICHIPRPGESGDVWWLGFDCHHSWDMAPAFASRMAMFGGEYRTLTYVQDQCRDLATQAATAAGVPLATDHRC